MANKKDDRTPIFQIKEKFEFLQEIFRKKGQPTSFAKAVGVSPSSYATPRKNYASELKPEIDAAILAKTDDEKTHAEGTLASKYLGSLRERTRQFTTVHIESIAACCSFSTKWHEWKDPEASETTPLSKRKDTLEDFKTKWRNQNCDKSDQILKSVLEHFKSFVGGSSEPVISDQFIKKKRNTNVLLEEDEDAAHKSFATELGSISLFTASQTTPPPGPGQVNIGFDLTSLATFEDETIRGFKRAFIEFKTGLAKTKRLSQLPGYPDGINYEDENAKFTPVSVEKGWPRWLVESIDGNEIGYAAHVPPWFLELSNVGANELISVLVTAYPMDIKVSLVLHKSSSKNGKISITEEKVSEWLQKLKLNCDDDGKVAIAGSGISFKIKENHAEIKDNKTEPKDD